MTGVHNRTLDGSNRGTETQTVEDNCEQKAHTILWLRRRPEFHKFGLRIGIAQVNSIVDVTVVTLLQHSILAGPILLCLRQYEAIQEAALHCTTA